MTHSVFLCFEIFVVILVWFDFDGNVLYYFESVGLQSHSFCGIVCEQAHFVYADGSANISPLSMRCWISLYLLSSCFNFSSIVHSTFIVMFYHSTLWRTCKLS